MSLQHHGLTRDKTPFQKVNSTHSLLEKKRGKKIPGRGINGETCLVEKFCKRQQRAVSC